MFPNDLAGVGCTIERQQRRTTDVCFWLLQAEAEKAQRMVMDMSQQRSASEASLTAAHQAITEAAARERELTEQLQKADEVSILTAVGPELTAKLQQEKEDH